jgi:hypothetical protein
MQDILENYSGEDVVLMGEVHTETAHQELEAEAVYRTNPRYVLSEGLDEAEPEEMNELVEYGEILSLRDVQRYFEDNFEDSQVFAESTEELYEKVQADQDEGRVGKMPGKVPESYNEFMDMPFFQMEGEVVNIISDSLKEHTSEEEDEWMKWYDETGEHEDRVDTKIDALYVANRTIRDMTNKRKMPESTGFLIQPINHLRKDGYNVDLAGCDVNKQDRYSDDNERNFELPDNLSPEEGEEQRQRMEENPEELAEDFANNLEFLGEIADDEEIEHRDDKMAARIKDFNQRNSTDRAVMAVVGADHLEGVRDSLENQGVSVYSEDLTEIVEPEDDPAESMRYALGTAEDLR